MKPSAIKTPPANFDPDTPLSDDEFDRGRLAVLARKARAASGYTQTEFAKKFGIPVASLRDWEQGRRRPDNASQSFLKAIIKLPKEIARALDAA